MIKFLELKKKKIKQLLKKVEECNKKGQPVLIGNYKYKKSEKISKLT